MSREKELERWLAVPGEWVEPPNERRGGLSGVQRIYGHDGQLLYRKQQTGHVYRSLSRPLGYPTVMREQDALMHCRRLGVPVPALVFAGCRKWEGVWQAVLLTEGLEGFESLEDCYRRKAEQCWGEVLHLQIIREVGRVIGLLNAACRQHGCLYLKHVFVNVSEGAFQVALIDLEKSRIRLSRFQAARHDLSQIARRSGWKSERWVAFIEGYRQSFARPLPRFRGRE